MCNCFSYNAQEGKVPNKILDPNKYFVWDSKARTVCVDACIADQIEMLWSNYIWTGGCCCGHGGLYSDNPSVVIADGHNAQKAKELLEKNDPDRNWIVKQWKLVNV